MKTITEQWLDFAKSDLDGAKRLFNSPKPNRWTYLLVLWHCHQVIEKTIKMVLIKQGKEILKIHDLLRLSQLTKLSLSTEDKNFLKDLNEFYIRPRYPDILYPALPDPSRKITTRFLKKTEYFFLWLQKQ